METGETREETPEEDPGSMEGQTLVTPSQGGPKKRSGFFLWQIWIFLWIFDKKIFWRKISNVKVLLGLKLGKVWKFKKNVRGKSVDDTSGLSPTSRETFSSEKNTGEILHLV